MTRQPFGKTKDGTPVEQFTLTNGRASSAGDHLRRDHHVDHSARSDGAIVGRYGNRIAKAASPSTAGPTSSPPTTVRTISTAACAGSTRSCGRRPPRRRERRRVHAARARTARKAIPGTLSASVTYTLTDANELIVDYHATTDKATPVNLTQPRYFNLAGEGPATSSATSCDRRRPLHAGRRDLIPTGELAPVEGTPFDFPRPTASGRPDRRGPRRSVGRRLRPQLRAQSAGRDRAGRARRRAESRPDARGLDHRAGRAVLHRQLPRWFVVLSWL